MKMLMFDYRESEKKFFETRLFQDLEIDFITSPLTSISKLTDDQLENTEILSVFISSTLTEEVLKQFKNLRVIATRSTGINHIDLEYCTKNNIAVCNVPHYGQKSVAQYTIAMILFIIRNLLPAYLDMQRNVLCHKNYEAHDLDKMTLGVIGTGSIGSTVAKMARFLGMNVIACSYIKDDEVATFAEYMSMKDLLSKADVITLHLPSTPENYHILGEEEFAKMKDGVYIVNTSRGELIDILILYENVISGKVKAAALDVLECEYLAGNNGSIIDDIKGSNQNCVANALITQKLLAMDNVVITPHIAYNTNEAIETLLATTFNNILDFYKGERTNRVC
ncbi:MAG: hydroxyacid dehydrogenase [bacterium]|nr:hydroxyacid dehydrogenase [bacterium]